MIGRQMDSLTMRVLFALILCLAPITRFPGFFYGVMPVKATFAAVVLAAWWLHRRRGGPYLAEAAASSSLRRPPHLRQLTVLLVALGAWSVLTTLTSSGSLALGIGPLLAVLTVVAFFFPFFEGICRSRPGAWRLEWVMVAATVAIACLAILQYVVMQFGVLSFLVELIIPKLDRDLVPAGGTLPLPDFGYRSWGTFHHPNLLGAYLALGFPLAVVLACGAGRYAGDDAGCRSKNRGERILWFLAALIIGAGIFCSGSRGAWLNVTVGVGVLVVLNLRRIPKAFFGAAVAVPLVTGLVFFDKVHQYFRLGNILSHRDIIWRHTWTLITEHPWLGRGPGTFSRTYLDRFDFPTYVERFSATRELTNLGQIHLLDNWHAHNLFLHFAAEMGLFATLLVILVFGLYFKALIQTTWRTQVPPTDPRRLLVAGCSAAVAGNLVHSVLETSTNFAFPAIGVPFIFIFALGLATLQQVDASSP